MFNSSRGFLETALSKGLVRIDVAVRVSCKSLSDHNRFWVGHF